jgi:hypothetical protein
VHTDTRGDWRDYAAHMPTGELTLHTESRFMLRTWIDESFELEGSRDAVFEALSALDRWPPTWVPELTTIWRRKPAGVGTTFLMVLRFRVLARVVLPCTISRWDQDVLEWGGGLAWSGVRHRFELHALTPTRTRVRHLEYATGLLGLCFRPFERFAHGFDHGWSEALAARFS